jgi:hypothetical protein
MVAAASGQLRRRLSCRYAAEGQLSASRSRAEAIDAS